MSLYTRVTSGSPNNVYREITFLFPNRFISDNLLYLYILYNTYIFEKKSNTTGTNYSLIKVAHGVCFALKAWKEYLHLYTFFITLGKNVTFPLITNFKTNKYLSYLSVVEYRFKIQPHWLIHDFKKPVLNLYFGFEFFIRKLDNSFCKPLNIRLKRTLMIDKHKNVIRY